MRGFALVALVSLLVSPVSAAQRESCDATGEIADVSGEDASLTLKTADGEKNYKVEIAEVDWHDLDDGQRVAVRCYKHPKNGPTISSSAPIPARACLRIFAEHAR